MISSIQFLRAAAALMVVWYHASFFANKFGGYTFSVTNGGAAGVDIFFVISGFIITYVTRANTMSPLDFMVRRIIRIAPPYWLYTSITVAILLSMPSAFAHLKFDGQHVLFSYLMLLSANNAGAIGTVLGVGWSICYEFYFYLLFAMFMFVPKRHALFGMSFVIVLGAILKYFVASPPLFSVALSALPLEFLAGCLLAKLYIRGIFLPKMSAIIAIVMGFTGIYWAGAIEVVTAEADSWRVLYFGLPAVFLVAGFLSLEGLGLAKFPKFVTGIGDASYSLYLSHQFVMLAVIKAWKLAHLSDYLPVWVLLFTATAVSVCAARLAYAWFEKPVTAWLNRNWQRQGMALA